MREQLDRPPYRGKPPLVFQVMSAIPQSSQAILTALYRETALLRPPGGPLLLYARITAKLSYNPMPSTKKGRNEGGGREGGREGESERRANKQIERQAKRRREGGREGGRGTDILTILPFVDGRKEGGRERGTEVS